MSSHTDAKSDTDRLGALALPAAVMLSGHALQSQGIVQADRWEEGHDPELFNLRRRTSRDEAAGSARPHASSSRGPPVPGSAVPQGDLPPHLPAQHPSGKVPVRTLPSRKISHRAEQLLCTDQTSVQNGCGDTVNNLVRRRYSHRRCSADGKSGTKQGHQDRHSNSHTLHRMALPPWQVRKQ